MKVLTNKLVSACLSLAAALMLSSCGGGGGGSDGIVGGGGGGGGNHAGTSMSAAELQRAQNMLALHNSYRAGLAVPLPALQWYAPAADVAFAHSGRQAAEGNIFHVDPVTGKDSCTRAFDAGISNDPGGFTCTTSAHPFVGENVAWGLNTSDQGIMNGWVASDGHLRQIVAPNQVAGSSSPAWTHCTIGVCDAGGGNVYWTAMFFRNPTP